MRPEADAHRRGRCPAAGSGTRRAGLLCPRCGVVTKAHNSSPRLSRAVLERKGSGRSGTDARFTPDRQVVIVWCQGACSSPPNGPGWGWGSQDHASTPSPAPYARRPDRRVSGLWDGARPVAACQPHTLGWVPRPGKVLSPAPAGCDRGCRPGIRVLCDIPSSFPEGGCRRSSTGPDLTGNNVVW